MCAGVKNCTKFPEGHPAGAVASEESISVQVYVKWKIDIKKKFAHSFSTPGRWCTCKKRVKSCPRSGKQQISCQLLVPSGGQSAGMSVIQLGTGTMTIWCGFAGYEEKREKKKRFDE